MSRITGVGITGFMKSGKDTFAKLLHNEIMLWKGSNYIVKHHAFAQPLKKFCIDYLGLNAHQAYDQEGKAEFNDFWGMTNREILQRVGTEAMRKGFHKDVWVKILELQIKEDIDNGEFFIVTDVRFENEADIIIRNGGIVIRMDRIAVEPKDLSALHPSEQPISEPYIDYTVDNNSDMEHLAEEARKLKCIIRDSWRNE